MTAKSRLALAAALALLTATSAGCSILNKPDRNQIQLPGDAGPGMDGSIIDGGYDAGDAGVDARIVGDACAQYQLQETRCDNHADDDCDGLTDCADNAGCGSAPSCCEPGGVSEATAAWPDSAEMKWGELTRTTPDPLTMMDGEITSFGTMGQPQATKHALCTPLMLGLRLTVTLTPQGGCAPGTCGDSYAGVVFTGAMGFPPTGPLLDDLRVAMQSDGVVAITQSRRAIATSSTAVTPRSTPVTLTIELSLGGDAAGNAVVFAEVTAPPLAAGAMPRSILERTPVIPLGQLVRGAEFPGCDALAGLYVAVEGVGSGVHVGALNMVRLACANPSRFEAPTTTIVSGTVHGGAWAAGGIGAPALASYSVSTTPRYDLVYDATNRTRSDELLTPLVFAIGRAKSTEVTGALWTEVPAGGAPVRGDPTGCLPGDATTPCTLSVREPTMLPNGTNLDGFFAHAVSGTEYELVAFGTPQSGALLVPPVSLADPVTAASLPVASDAQGHELAACRSLRDPALAFAGPNGSDGFWLFFSCERAITGKYDIRAIRLTSELSVADAQIVVVATPEQVGREGAVGVRGPEVVTQFDALIAGSRVMVSAFRVWFVATASSGRTTIWLAQAQGQGLSPPTFELYPINPILTPSSAGVDCEGRCTFGSLAVTRRVNEPGELQFLLARSVDLPDGTRRFELLPMAQVVEEFWRR